MTRWRDLNHQNDSVLGYGQARIQNSFNSILQGQERQHFIQFKLLPFRRLVALKAEILKNNYSDLSRPRKNKAKILSFKNKTKTLKIGLWNFSRLRSSLENSILSYAWFPPFCCHSAVAVSPFRSAVLTFCFTVAVLPFRSYRCRCGWERKCSKRLSVYV